MSLSLRPDEPFSPYRLICELQASRILPVVFGSAAVWPTERSGLWQAHESPRQGLRRLDFAGTTDVRGIDMGRASPGEATGRAPDGVLLT